MTDQERYENLCLLLGDVVAQISQLEAAKTVLLAQIARLKNNASTAEEPNGNTTQ